MAQLGTIPAVTDVTAGIAELVSSYREQTNVPGVCISIYDPKHFGSAGRVFPFGLADVAAKQPIAADTVFEIGSVTKVFTSLLMASAVVDPGTFGVSLTDKVVDYLRGYTVTGSQLLQQISIR